MSTRHTPTNLTTMSRREALKIGAGLVIGTSLGALASESTPRGRGRDQCRVRAWRRQAFRAEAACVRRERPLRPGLVRHRHRRLRRGRAGFAQRVRTFVSRQGPARPNASLRGQASRRSLPQRTNLHHRRANSRPEDIDRKPFRRPRPLQRRRHRPLHQAGCLENEPR